MVQPALLIFFKAAYDCVLDPGQVDFIWINRDQKSFEWFVSLLTKLEMDQADEEPEGERQLPRPLQWGKANHSDQLLFFSARSLPGDAHVHDVGAQQERHEGHRAADGAGPAGQEGEEGLHHGPEDQDPAGAARVGQGEESLLCTTLVTDVRVSRSVGHGGVVVCQVFQKVSEENKGKVHVFYCGSPALAKVIKAQCEHFSFNFYKENF